MLHYLVNKVEKLHCRYTSITSSWLAIKNFMCAEPKQSSWRIGDVWLSPFENYLTVNLTHFLYHRTKTSVCMVLFWTRRDFHVATSTWSLWEQRAIELFVCHFIALWIAPSSFIFSFLQCGNKISNSHGIILTPIYCCYTLFGSSFLGKLPFLWLVDFCRNICLADLRCYILISFLHFPSLPRCLSELSSFSCNTGEALDPMHFIMSSHLSEFV